MDILIDLLNNGKIMINEKIKFYIKNNKYSNISIDILQNILHLITEKIIYILKMYNSETCIENIKKEFYGSLFDEMNKIIGYLPITHENIYEFIKLSKLFKKSYLELIQKSELSDKNKLECCNFIGEFFDELEVKFTKAHYENSENNINSNTFIKITSALVFMYDKEKNIYINKAAEEFTGYSLKEIQQISFEDLIHTEYKDKINLFKSEENILQNKEEKDSLHEFKITTKSGEEKWIEFNITTVSIKNKNVMLGIAFDISKRKKIEEDLRESESRYRTLLELMPDAIYAQGEDGIVYANNAGVKLLGASSAEELIGKNIIDFLIVEPYYKILMKQQEDILLRNGKLPPLERKFTRKSDGEELIVETSSDVVYYGEKKVILNISRDITERKKIQMLKEKIKEKTMLLKQAKEYDDIKTEFFANISHELRTPLNVILGVVQLLERISKKETDVKLNDERIKRYRKITKQNSYRLVRLVNNLIDITKIDAGYMNLNLRNYNIVSAVEDITLSVAEYIESKGLNLIFDTDIEEKYISIDPDKIERIILNLLSNAVKFTKPEGSIVVNVFDCDEKVKISVKDTGIGIPKNKQKEIFKRFIQVDKSLSRDREGSGIGLSLVKAFVDMHEGKISLISEHGKGSEFIIELPAKTKLEKNEKKEHEFGQYSNIELGHIEFSDIYSC